MVLDGDLRELLCSGSEAFHVLDAGSTEHVRSGRHRELLQLGESEEVPHEWLFTVVVGGSEGPGLHLLEAQRQCAVGLTALDCLRGEVERGRSRRTVVVDVDDGDARQTQLVDSR